MKSKHMILAGGLLLAAMTSYACKCGEHNLAADIAYADAVFVGKVVTKQDMRIKQGEYFAGVTAYTFEVKRIYKGKIGNANRYTVYQGTSSCNRRTFLENETYLVFSNDSSVNQCNLTGRFENNPNVQLLDSFYVQTMISDTRTEAELRTLIDKYNNYVSLSDNSDAGAKLNQLAIAGKKCVFWDGKQMWLGKKNIHESDNDFSRTSYYLAADRRNSSWLQETGADYLILVSHQHQAMTMKPGWMNDQKPKSRIVKKIKAITSI